MEQRNATGLKDQIEQLLRVELIDLIREKADSRVVDDKIAEINAKLDVAIVIVPEFPLAALGTIAAAVGIVAVLGRARLLRR